MNRLVRRSIDSVQHTAMQRALKVGLILRLNSSVKIRVGSIRCPGPFEIPFNAVVAVCNPAILGHLFCN